MKRCAASLSAQPLAQDLLHALPCAVVMFNDKVEVLAANGPALECSCAPETQIPGTLLAVEVFDCVNTQHAGDPFGLGVIQDMAVPHRTR